jgi:hypothetical protein
MSMYGGVYIGVAVLWLWLIDGIQRTAWDLIGAAIALAGMSVVMLGSDRPAAGPTITRLAGGFHPVRRLRLALLFRAARVGL